MTQGGRALVNKLNLAAVQARMTLADYASAAAFRRKVSHLMDQVATAVHPSYPTLAVFPEGIGLYLSFVPFYYQRLQGADSLRAALPALLPQLPHLVREALRWRRLSPAVLALAHAVEAEAMYRETFSDLARSHGLYVQAGSMYTPHVDHDPIGGARPMGKAVYNTAYTFAPTGALLGRTHKVNFAPGLEQALGLSHGALEELRPLETAVGKLGVLICMDGFFRSLVERLDGLGARVLAMPSYEMSRWDARSQVDPSIRQGEQWLRDGLPTMLQGRENLRYGVNPMLVGSILGMEAQGRSTVCAGVPAGGKLPDDAIVAIAPDPTAEAVVSALVQAPWLT